MCGIAGAFAPQPNPPDLRPGLERALVRLERRGPDGGGVASGKGWAFGHRRLAIIDLAGGAQPFTGPGGAALTYNGELYNTRELREELRSAGWTFTTASDTEVVLKAWLAWGPECLPRFNGMFAFAVYDPSRDSVFLARDHLGIKPLFHHTGPVAFHFASTLAALLAFPGVDAVADPVGVSHYLSTTKVVLGTRTLIRGVSCLEPGTWMEVRRGRPPSAPARYWSPPAVSPEPLPFAEAAARVRELVGDSVRRQLVSDVPLGGFLSGGLDSTVIASLASRHSPRPYHAYSVGYAEGSDAYQEWDYAREAAAAYGLACDVIPLRREDYPGDWRLLIAEKGQPLSTPNEVGIYRLARALKSDSTVALSGEGADEVFGGYSVYFSAHDYERSRGLDRMAPEGRASLSAALKRMYGTDRFGSLTDHFIRTVFWMGSGAKFALLRPQWREALRDDETLLRHYLGRFEDLRDLSPFDAYLRMILEKNLENLLFRLDSSTMAASVEGRVPFTDPRLVSLLFSLPGSYKMAWAPGVAEEQRLGVNTAEAEAQGWITGKLLLRAAFADAVPERILKRPKMSFPVPFREWFAGPMRPLVESLLRENPWARDWLAPAAVDALVAGLNQPHQALLAWPLVNLCLWQQEFGVSWGSGNPN